MQCNLTTKSDKSPGKRTCMKGQHTSKDFYNICSFLLVARIDTLAYERLTFVGLEPSLTVTVNLAVRDWTTFVASAFVCQTIQTMQRAFECRHPWCSEAPPHLHEVSCLYGPSLFSLAIEPEQSVIPPGVHTSCTRPLCLAVQSSPARWRALPPVGETYLPGGAGETEASITRREVLEGGFVAANGLEVVVLISMIAIGTGKSWRQSRRAAYWEPSLDLRLTPPANPRAQHRSLRMSSTLLPTAGSIGKGQPF